MAKYTESIFDKAVLAPVPTKPARVKKVRKAPEKIQQTHIIRQAKGGV